MLVRLVDLIDIVLEIWQYRLIDHQIQTDILVRNISDTLDLQYTTMWTNLLDLLLSSDYLNRNQLLVMIFHHIHVFGDLVVYFVILEITA